MPPVNLDTLRDHCAGRITAEVLGAPSFQEVEVGGAPRLFAETGSGGTGNNAVWVESSWLIDLSTCDAVVLDINGSRRSSERWTSFRGAGSTEERDWLLRKAGYVPFDASNPAHALAALAAIPPVATEPQTLTVGALKVSVVTAPALNWRTSPVPHQFTPAWLPLEAPPDDLGQSCPCYLVPHAQTLIDHTQNRGAWRLHEYYNEPLLLAGAHDDAFVVEDTARHRWAFYEGDRVTGAPVGTDPQGADPDAPAPAPPPAALRAWTWTQQGPPEDFGVASVFAQGSQPWTWVRLDLQVQEEAGWSWAERVTWVDGGLSVTPEHGEAILVPTTTLLGLLPR